MIALRSTPAGHVAIVHTDPEQAEGLAKLLRTAGHRITLVTPGRRVVQGILDCSPDLLIGSTAITDPTLETVVRGVRQALGQDPPVLVLYQGDLKDAPAETDEILHEPVEPLELELRVDRLLRSQAERRVRERKLQELLGLYKMSWAFSLAGGSDTLYGLLARQCAELLKAERCVVFRFDTDRRQMVAQAPGFGFTPEQLGRARYSVDGEARSRWNFRKNGPLVSNKAKADTRVLTDLIEEMGVVSSLMVAPMTRGPQVQGL